MYFEAFKADLPKGVLENTTVEIEGEGKNTLSLIEEIKRIRDRREKTSGRPYDQVWAVFDKDSFSAQNFNAAIFKARDCVPEIRCAWSNEAFELWYLLHFEFYHAAISRDLYKEKLEQAISKKMGKPSSTKNDSRYIRFGSRNMVT
ncbi:MAG: RloB domain-containing protein [Saprospirales bacterium]|nr:RloB domain-containing protein [Saprospirales bacterium]